MGRKKTGSVRFHRGGWEAWNGKEYLKSWPTEAEAWEVVEAAIKTDEGNPKDTLRVFGRGWIERREIEARERGKARAGLIEVSRWNTHVVSASFIDKPLSKITPKLVQQWVRALQVKHVTGAIYTGQAGKKAVRLEKRDRTLNRRTVANTLNLLALCFDEAMVEGLMSSNPARVVKLGRAAVGKHEGELVDHLTAAEIERLFALPLPPRERAFFSLAVYGGLRLGELLGLRWGDIDGKRIMVRRAYNSSVKSKPSVRDVPALPPVIEAVRAYRASLATPPIGGLMFAADGGSCHGPSYTMAWTDKLYRKGGQLRVREGWARKAGVIGKTFHVLRHTCGCHLLMGTWKHWTGPLEMHDVSRWLGHSSIAVTERHYSQLSKDALTNRVQRVLNATKLNATKLRKEDEGT